MEDLIDWIDHLRRFGDSILIGTYVLRALK